MFALIKALTDPGEHLGADVLGPVLEPSRVPLLLLAMTRGHVTGLGGHAWPIGPGMTGDLLLAKVELDEVLTGVQLDLLTDILVRDRVVVLIELDVVVDVDLAAANVDIRVRVLGQRFERGLVQGLEGLLAVTR